MCHDQLALNVHKSILTTTTTKTPHLEPYLTILGIKQRPLFHIIVLEIPPCQYQILKNIALFLRIVDCIVIF
jgi:hypothetical protein